MSPVLEKGLAPAATRPLEPGAEAADSRFEVTVIFTSLEATFSALRAAGALSARLGARIALVVPQLVPFPLPLHSPPVQVDFNERRLRQLASESRVETVVRVYLCRDPSNAFAMALKPRSLIVLGSRKRWWPTAEARLAGTLRRAGHLVILTETE
jgi:hypothetical protein